jgi:hypothetical protein
MKIGMVIARDVNIGIELLRNPAYTKKIVSARIDDLTAAIPHGPSVLKTAKKNSWASQYSLIMKRSLSPASGELFPLVEDVDEKGSFAGISCVDAISLPVEICHQKSKSQTRIVMNEEK